MLSVPYGVYWTLSKFQFQSRDCFLDSIFYQWNDSEIVCPMSCHRSDRQEFQRRTYNGITVFCQRPRDGCKGLHPSHPPFVHLSNSSDKPGKLIPPKIRNCFRHSSWGGNLPGNLGTNRSYQCRWCTGISSFKLHRRPKFLVCTLWLLMDKREWQIVAVLFFMSRKNRHDFSLDGNSVLALMTTIEAMPIFKRLIIVVFCRLQNGIVIPLRHYNSGSTSLLHRFRSNW